MYTANAKQLTFTKKRHSAYGKREKKREHCGTWSLLPFTFHANEVPNLSNEIGNTSRPEVRRGV